MALRTLPTCCEFLGLKSVANLAIRFSRSLCDREAQEQEQPTCDRHSQPFSKDGPRCHRIPMKSLWSQLHLAAADLPRARFRAKAVNALRPLPGQALLHSSSQLRRNKSMAF